MRAKAQNCIMETCNLNIPKQVLRKSLAVTCYAASYCECNYSFYWHFRLSTSQRDNTVYYKKNKKPFWLLRAYQHTQRIISWSFSFWNWVFASGFVFHMTNKSVPGIQLPGILNTGWCLLFLPHFKNCPLLFALLKSKPWELSFITKTK